MKNEIAKRIEELENKINKLKKDLEYGLAIGSIDVYDEIDYRMYISDLYDELDELYSL